MSPYGFETSAWDPSKDKHLPETFSAQDIRGKAVCKAVLQKRLGFPQHASTILVSISMNCQIRGLIFASCSISGLKFVNATGLSM